MKCPRCQAENPESARFCNGCGARLELTCPACGNSNPPGSRFCNGCGHQLTEAAPAQGRYASPESYTPGHLAEKILTSKSALEGERKQVTVLFADLKGSTELLADRDPEEARTLLDPVLERMMEAVHRYEGTVNQVMGDGIMALFGAPLAHEDHAIRACYAGLRMLESVGRYGDELQRAQGVPVQIRVGLNSGEVVVRAVGSDLRMDYTAVGQTTQDPSANDLVEQVVQSSLRLPPHTVLSFFTPDPTRNIVPLLDRVTVPTLVMHGTEDVLVPFDEGRYLAEHIPAAQLYAFEGRDHLPIFTATAEFCEALRRFARTGTIQAG